MQTSLFSLPVFSNEIHDISFKQLFLQLFLQYM